MASDAADIRLFASLIVWPRPGFSDVEQAAEALEQRTHARERLAGAGGHQRQLAVRRAGDAAGDRCVDGRDAARREQGGHGLGGGRAGGGEVDEDLEARNLGDGQRRGAHGGGTGQAHHQHGGRGRDVHRRGGGAGALGDQGVHAGRMGVVDGDLVARCEQPRRHA
jgi:hypothetical protein